MLDQVNFMSEFMLLDAKAPATMEAVIEAVTRLSTFSEAQILELVSAGKMKDLFPFKPASDQEVPADTAADEELIEASASPLNREQRRALIQSSMPVAATSNSRRSSTTEPKSARKRYRSLSKK
jgi:hypothetical protein